MLLGGAMSQDVGRRSVEFVVGKLALGQALL